MATQGDRANSNAGAERRSRGDAASHGREEWVALTVAGPWPRCWAKMFDLTLGALLLLLPAGVVAFVAPSVFQAFMRVSSISSNFLFTALVVAIEAMLYGVFGNTPGKRLLGLKVLSLEGDRLGLRRMFRRDFGVFFLGMGMCLPLVSVFTLVRAHHKAKDGEPQPWDVATRSRCYSVRNEAIRTWIGAAITVALALAIFGAGTFGG